jgi:outer membrane protein W
VRRVQRDESGATLLLAIAFLIVVGLIGGGVITLVSSAAADRAALDNARNREYAADGAIEGAIAQVRVNMTSGQALTPCTTLPPAPTLNGVTIEIGCTFAPTLTTTRYLQRNVIFTAQCAAPYTAKCQNGNVITRAQIDFASPSLATDTSIAVTRTYVQAWSVNA